MIANITIPLLLLGSALLIQGQTYSLAAILEGEAAPVHCPVEAQKAIASVWHNNKAFNASQPPTAQSWQVARWAMNGGDILGGRGRLALSRWDMDNQDVQRIRQQLDFRVYPCGNGSQVWIYLDKRGFDSDN